MSIVVGKMSIIVVNGDTDQWQQISEIDKSQS